MANGEKKPISMSVIRRLPRYYRFLFNLMAKGVHRISSRELSEIMGLTASQIRQDLNCFGGFGQQGYGYVVDDLYDEIGLILGMDVYMPTIVLGAGNIGKAICNRIDFNACGFSLAGIFERDSRLIGTEIAGKTVMHVDKLEEICSAEKAKMAIICIPDDAVPGVVERLIPLGVENYWNFSHFDIKLGYESAIVENVHLDDSLMTLSYQTKNKDKFN